MSKFGVGVGDEFPLNDGERGNPAGGDQAPPQDDREEFEEWKRRRDEYRAQREDRHRQREQWRREKDEWRARRHAFKKKVRQAARDSFGPRWGEHDGNPYYGWRFGGRGGHRFPFLLWPAVGLLIPILILALIVSLIAAIFKSPFAFLALMALGIGVFMWRHHHHDHYGFDGCDYDFDLRPRDGGRQNPPSPPAQNGNAIITPPPSPDAGKSAS